MLCCVYLSLRSHFEATLPQLSEGYYTRSPSILCTSRQQQCDGPPVASTREIGTQLETHCCAQALPPSTTNAPNLDTHPLLTTDRMALQRNYYRRCPWCPPLTATCTFPTVSAHRLYANPVCHTRPSSPARYCSCLMLSSRIGFWVRSALTNLPFRAVYWDILAYSTSRDLGGRVGQTEVKKNKTNDGGDRTHTLCTITETFVSQNTIHRASDLLQQNAPSPVPHPPHLSATSITPIMPASPPLDGADHDCTRAFRGNLQPGTA